MDPFTGVSSEQQGKTPAPIPSDSKCLQDDDALSGLMIKDPSLGQVMKLILGKLNETNMKLDETNEKLDETNRKLDTCQDQVTKLLEAQGMEKDDATTMAMIPVVNAEELEENRRQFIHDCLGLPTILRRILEQFSNKELVHLSLVNKLWNNEARSVLRDRGSLKATINSEPICRRLLEFASDIRQMRVVPFNGISLKVNHYGEGRDACDLRPIDAQLDPAYRDILDRLPWKHLTVEFNEDLWYCQGCPALVLVKKILEDYCGVLEELSISNLDNEKTEFVQSIIQDRSFPRLQTLTVLGPILANAPNLFMKGLLSCAPNLQEFNINSIVGFDPNVMEGSSSKLAVALAVRPWDERVCKSLVDALRTEKIDANLYNHEDFDVELLNRFVPRVIQGSLKKLKFFSMDLVFAVPLMCYGMCLENVTNLLISVSDPVLAGIQPHILEILKRFEFSRFFPKLNRVGITCWDYEGLSSEHISAFVERGNAVSRVALPDPAINIKHLEISGPLGYLTTLLLKEMFPHVIEITVGQEHSGRFSFQLLWEHFGCLEELHVNLNDTDTIVNLDSVFCGIFPEEVAELRTKDDEYLKAVNIVPVMPSITSLKGLRRLTFYHSVRRGCKFVSTVKDSQLLFTKVTDVLAFQRSRDLAVTLTIGRGNRKVSHMKPNWSILPVGSVSAARRCRI